MHIGPCPHMQVHFSRSKYLVGSHESTRRTLALQCRCHLVYSSSKLLQLGLQKVILVTILTFLKFAMYVQVH